MACNCPPGYVLLNDGITCERVEPASINIGGPVESPLTRVRVNDNIRGNAAEGGLVVYENITSNQNGGTKQWPILLSPQDIYSYTVIEDNAFANSYIVPAIGPNWTSIFPPYVFGGGLAPTSIPLPSPWPPAGVPSNLYTTTYLKPLRQSVVTSSVLYYGTGTPLNITNYISAYPWKNNLPTKGWADSVGVWTKESTNPYYNNEWCGFGNCFYVDQPTQYFILVSASHSFRIVINDLLALDNQNKDTDSCAYNFVHAFPITLQPGYTKIEVLAYNFSQTDPGQLSYELLNISLSDLIAANSPSDLIPYRAFSTEWKKPRSITLTTGSISGQSQNITSAALFNAYDIYTYLCDIPGIPSDWFIVKYNNSSSAIAKTIVSFLPVGNTYTGLTAPVYTSLGNNASSVFICIGGDDCATCYTTVETDPVCLNYYTLNDCCTGDPFLLNGETIYLKYDGTCIPNYCPEDILPKIITTFEIEGGELFSGCYQLTEVPTPPPGSVETNYNNLINDGTITVPTCEDCQTCSQFFQLEDCANGNTVVTCDNLTNYVGKVIKLKNCPDVCWKVSIATDCTDAKLLEDEIIDDYPPAPTGEKTCVYDIDNAVDTRAIPAGCIASVVIYINGIPYTFPYTTPENLVALINTLGLGYAEYVEN